MRTLFIAALAFFLLSTASAGNVCIYYFWQTGCGACSRMAPYLDQFESQYGIDIHKFELHSFDSWQVLFQIDEYYGKDFSVEQMMTPTTFIGDKMVVGFKPDELESYIISNLETGCACPGEEQCNTTNGNFTNGNYTDGIVPATIPLNPLAIMAAAITVVVIMVIIGAKIRL